MNTLTTRNVARDAANLAAGARAWSRMKPLPDVFAQVTASTKQITGRAKLKRETEERANVG